MVVCAAGIKVTIDTQNYWLVPGDLYIAFPNVLHAIEAENAEVVAMIVDFEKYPAFQDVLLHTYPQMPVLRKGQFAPIVYEILDRMVSLGGETPYRMETLEGYANALLGELLGCMKLVKRSSDSSLVQKLIFYVLQNYTRPITLDSMAQSLGYSKYYISREIRKLFGCNLCTLINSYRLSMAQNLLLSGNAPISQIAADCGFQNQSAFNRVFLKHIGMTPGKYRKEGRYAPEMPAVYVKD